MEQGPERETARPGARPVLARSQPEAKATAGVSWPVAELEFVNDSQLAAEGVAALLAQTRTDFDYAQAAEVSVNGKKVPASLRIFWRRNVVQLQFEGRTRVGPGSKLLITLRYRGDPPDPVGAVWLSSRADTLRQERELPIAARPAEAAEIRRRHHKSVVDIYGLRTRMIRELPRHNRRADEFFLRLDVRTMPQLLRHPDYPRLYRRVFGRDDRRTESQRAELAMAVTWVRRYLLHRTQQRAKLAKSGKLTLSVPASTTIQANRIALVEKEVRGAFAFFEGDRKGMTPEGRRRLREYFLDFVTGKLRILPDANGGHPLRLHGIPDGIMFVCFAEAALYFSGQNVNNNGGYWRDCVKTFVLVSDIFQNLYWTGDGRRERAYGPAGLDNHVGDGEHWNKLWEAFGQVQGGAGLKKLERVFGVVCGTALRDPV